MDNQIVEDLKTAPIFYFVDEACEEGYVILESDEDQLEDQVIL